MMEKNRKSVLRLFALLLFLACLLLPSAAAVPLSRRFALRSQEVPVLEVADNVMSQEVRKLEEEIAKMDIESSDYPGSGANNRHDPKSPGRA